MDFYETAPVIVPERDEPASPIVEQPETLPTQQPQQAPQAPAETVFLGDSHSKALQQFSGVKGKHLGVDGAHIEQIIRQLEQATPNSRVYMTAGTNDGVGKWDEPTIRAHVARANQIAQDRNLDITWVGPTGKNAKALDDVLSNASTGTKLKYKSLAGVTMQMQPDGYHATIDDKGYGAMWRSLNENAAPATPATNTPPPTPTQKIVPEGLRLAIINTAKELGINPVDLATVISYETGGTFNQWQLGPRTQWGRHIGLIQMGEPQRRQHNYVQGDTYENHLKAVASYLRSTGVQPGHGLLQIYAAINAGHVSKIHLSDAHNGGAWGTVLDKVKHQMHGHKRKAAAIIGDGAIDFAAPVQDRDIQAAPSAPPEIATMQATKQAQEKYDNSSYWQIIKDSFSNDNLTGRIIQNLNDNQQFNPDPQFLLTPEVQTQLQTEFNLSKDSMGQLSNALSLQHARYLAGVAKQSEERDALMAQYGWTGVGIRVGAALLDPVALAAGVATGGLADMAVVATQGTRIARVASQLVAGAGTNVGIDLAMRELGDPHAAKNLALTAATGALFGASYGILARNPATVEEAIMLQRASATLRKSLDNATPEAAPMPNLSAGAAQNPNANIPALNDAVINALTQESAAKTAYGSVKFFGKEVPLRWSAVGQLGRSEDPLARIGASLGEDGVGKVNHALSPFARSEEAMLIYDRLRTDLYNSWKPSIETWATEQGYKVGARIRAASDFNQLVHRAVVDRSPNASYHPEVSRIADKIRKLNAEVLALAKNPFERERLIGRAVRGFEEVPENPFYMMRIYDDAKINTKRAMVGDTGLQTLFRGSIKSAQPELEDDLIDTLARHFVTRITRRANGVDDDFNRLVNGDTEVLAAILRDIGTPEEELRTILSRWDRHQLRNQQGVDARARHRLLMDETFTVRNYPTSPEWRAQNPNELTTDITLSDLVLNDAMELSERYFRHMSGRISMAKWRPTDEKSGQMLLNGITSDSEFETFLQRVRESGNKQGLTKSEIEKNVENLTFLYHRTLGRPDPAQMTGWGNWLRRTRAAEYMRLGLNMGIAQLPEFVMPVAQLGLKASLTHVPALRRMVNMEGEEVLRSGLAQEIEAMFGRAHLPSGSYLRDDATGAVAAGATGKIDNALTLGVNAVNEMSGMALVNKTLITSARHGILQKFADMALDPSKAQLKRMASIGLSKPMLDRVLKQLRNDQIVKREQGFSGKLAELNLHKWDDQEARVALENSVWRWSRRVIQQNDVGQMHRWFTHPAWQMILQFRAFPLVAWEKQVLHGLHIRDMNAFNTLWMSMAAGTAVYVAHTHLQSIGKPDREAFLDRRLSLTQIAAGGFQRAGWSSILPIIMDTGTAITGIDPIFNARTTGQPTSILGFPALSHLDDFSKAMRGIVQPWAENRERSRPEYEAITRSLTNWWPIMSLMGTLTEGAPPRAPRNQ